jgi:hypothetical protein
MRCPYCFDRLSGLAVVCPDCGTILHEECFTEHGRCVVLGCAGRAPLRRPRIEVAVAQRPRRSRRGLLGASLLVGVLGATWLALAPTSCSSKSRIGADIDAIHKASETFKLNCRRYPIAMSELWRTAGDAKGWCGPYLDQNPCDPWGDPYVLLPRTDGRPRVAISVMGVGPVVLE